MPPAAPGLALQNHHNHFNYNIYYMIMTSETPAIVLGALTAIGGVMGYVRTGSVPSIAAGVTVGLLYLMGGYRINARTPYGVELSLLASIILGGSSIPRAVKTRKPLPAFLGALAIYGFIVYGGAYRNRLPHHVV